MRPRLVVSVHDVSPATAAETARWCADADTFGIPVSLLVIPGPWRGCRLADEPGYAEVLRARVAGGDELVLHGWSHQAGPAGGRFRRAIGRVLARGAAEFAALDEDEAGRRLADGRAVLDRLDLSVSGFTPPGWLASPAVCRVLARSGFRYTTTHFGVRDLHSGQLHPGFALSHRPSARSRLGTAERLGASVVRWGARAGAAHGGLVRIALHPDDLHRPGLRDTTLGAIEAVLAAGGRAVTYGAIVAEAAEPP